MRSTLSEFAGGEQAFAALARAHHARCLADPELDHPFSHEGINPEHVERSATYWAEVRGGPLVYSTRWSDQNTLLTLHAGNGDISDHGRRFVECFMPPTTPGCPPTRSSAQPCGPTWLGRGRRPLLPGAV